MNDNIFFFFYSLARQSEIFDSVVIFIAETLPYVVIILAGLFLSRRFSRDPDPKASGLFYRKSWREFFLVFISSGVAYIVSKILKILIHIDRPFVEFSSVQPLFSETGFAFPSGHATFFMALAISIFLLHKKAGYIFIFFALLIGLARIIAGVHFPIDILGGFILGALISYLFAYFSKSV